MGSVAEAFSCLHSIEPPSGDMIRKKLLKDYSDEKKFYDIPCKRTTIIDSEGFLIIVNDHIKDRLVIENPFEDPIHKLAQRFFLSPRVSSQYMKLQKQLLDEFRQAAKSKAISDIWKEKEALYSPEVIRLTTFMMASIYKTPQAFSSKHFLATYAMRSFKIIQTTDSHLFSLARYKNCYKDFTFCLLFRQSLFSSTKTTQDPTLVRLTIIISQYRSYYGLINSSRS